MQLTKVIFDNEVFIQDEERNTNPVNDYLFDYLLFSFDGMTPDSDNDQKEYARILKECDKDIVVDNWHKYTTCFGNFIHFENKITKEVL